MTAPYNPPVKGEDFKIRIALDDINTTGAFKVNPTLAVGDFKVDIDGAGFNNLATAPTVSPASGPAVLLTLSASEMNGDLITVLGIDQSDPKEWGDFFMSIPTTV